MFLAHLTYFKGFERPTTRPSLRCLVYKNLWLTGAKSHSSRFNGVNYIKRPAHAHAGKTAAHVCVGVVCCTAKGGVATAKNKKLYRVVCAADLFLSQLPGGINYALMSEKELSPWWWKHLMEEHGIQLGEVLRGGFLKHRL